MDSEIEFTFHDVQFELLNQEDIRFWLGIVVSRFSKTIQHLNIIFCSDEYLLEVNKAHLEHDYYTDIITFPFSDPTQSFIAGDLFISYDRVKDNAESMNSSFIDELHRVIAHGVLHLCGLDDHTEQQVTEMRNQENIALSLRMF